ncbi:heparan-alpha-glucosaminide N-acetyltransferase [Sinorhizobium americanum]|uniref:Putative membrane protein n=1 Tax=Sinorhizobium americanum TaxID=194963 RepID=A0A4R2AXF0_9HYPH|nr:putative membrane protein [Sinorhizobium americanum]
MPETSATTIDETPTEQPAVMRRGRIDLLDALRGLALVAMAIYHFTWDLEFFGYVAAGTAGTGGWRLFARLIASSFLFLAGYSLVLGHSPKFRARPFLKRFTKIAGAAALISVATFFAMPQSFIFFGILHAIAAASLVGILFLRLPAPVSFLAAAAAFAAPLYLRSAFFDGPALWWVGLSETLPRSNDYVPLLPWLAPFLLGLGAAKLFHPMLIARWQSARNDQGNGKLWIKPLAFAGRHSLAIYLIHQPLLIGLVYAFSLVVPAPVPDPAQAYRLSCEQACSREESGISCSVFCGCTLDQLREQNLFEDLNQGKIDLRTDERIARIATQCTMEAQSGD